MPIRASVLLSSSLLLAAAAQAAPNAQMPASKLFEAAAQLERLPSGERDAIALRHTLVSKTPGTVVKVWYQDQGQRVELPLRADGSFERPAGLAKPGFDPVVQADRPEDDLDLNIDLVAKVPDPRQFDYADLQRSATQMNGFIKRQAGMLSLLAPKVHSMVFRCASATPPCALVVHLPEGAKTYKADAKGQIALRMSPELQRAQPKLTTEGQISAIVGDME